MSNRATNFSYFFPQRPFCEVETQLIYPSPMRPSDPELDQPNGVDKVMVMLNIAEDQLVNMMTARPFEPTDLGFEEQRIPQQDGPDTITYVMGNVVIESVMDKAMTYQVSKFKPAEGDLSPTPEFSIEVFLPNKVTASIVLQSIGAIDLHNPAGIYEAANVESALVRDADVEEDSFEIVVHAPAPDGNIVTGKRDLVLSASSVRALEQISILAKEKNTMNFKGVTEAIQNHIGFTDEQKRIAFEKWGEFPQSEGSVAEVKVSEE